jgi:hypothetical protein
LGCQKLHPCTAGSNVWTLAQLADKKIPSEV